MTVSSSSFSFLSLGNVRMLLLLVLLAILQLTPQLVVSFTPPIGVLPISHHHHHHHHHHHGRPPTTTFKSLSNNHHSYQTQHTTTTTRLTGTARPDLNLISGSGSSSGDMMIDIVSILFGGSVLAFYHIQLYIKERKGISTWRSSQADTRELWSKYVRDTQGWLYAIQTLRNAITAQTFLATTVLSLLTVIGGRLWEMVRSTTITAATTVAATTTAATAAATTTATTQSMANKIMVFLGSCCTTASTSTSRNYAILQLVLFTTPMISSAYYFLQSARLMTHAGFMFPVHPKSTKVDLLMRKTEHCQWLGLRCFYIAGGILSLVVGGPKVFSIISLLLTRFFYTVDQAPISL